MEAVKQTACNAIDGESENLHKLSKSIWRHPEVAFEEKHAHSVLTDFLQTRGFIVEKGYILPTAFRAVYGETGTGPHVLLISEYDALPGIGHANGHNLIAEVGVAAGIGIKAAMEAAGKPIGKVTVLGTPAEEGGGAKISLITGGAFNDVDVAMMAHPAPRNELSPYMIAAHEWSLTYHGKAAHASAYPWEGVNALDSAVMCYQSLSCLRQQIKPPWRIHAIITDGGSKVNIIPESASMNVCIRAPTEHELKQLKAKVLECCEAAAKATGCTITYGRNFDDEPFAAMSNNSTLTMQYKQNTDMLGVDMERTPSDAKSFSASTDMGNVSKVVPSIHPNFYIGGVGANYTRDFIKDSGDPVAQPYTLNQAKALAMTAIDVMTKPGLLEEIKSDFNQNTEVTL